MKKKTAAWINRHRQRVGRAMVRVDFDRFMTSCEVTVEELAALLGYTVGGVIKMLARGTAKERAVRDIGKKHPKISKYLRGAT